MAATEGAGLAFFTRVAETYDALARENPRFVVLDAALAPEQVLETALAAVQ